MFTVDEIDVELLSKLSPTFAGKSFAIPIPTLCPECREQQRLVWRNERKLYNRICDLTKKDIISVHAPDKSYPVYSSEAWWGDGWDPFSYGKDFDFSRPFFDQLKELFEQVPRAALYNQNNVNSEYNQSTGNLKNCYLLAGADYDEDCYYGNYLFYCRNCVDGLNLQNCELCYECVDAENCYNCSFCFDSSNCRDSKFLYSCRNCSNCFGCVNLANKQHCFFNEQLSEAEYKKRITEFDLSKYSVVKDVDKLMQERLQKYPVRYMRGTANENVSGDSLSHSKQSHYCFDGAKLENCNYCVFFYQAKDCMDIFAWGMSAELCYSCMEVGGGTSNMLFSATCFSSHNLLYSFQCHNSSHCFGCSGLRHKQYCIFNKQYSKEDYEMLVSQIIAHMGKAKEWGEFFPMALSGFGYDETIAQDYYPRDQKDILALGGLWRDEDEAKIYGEKPVVADSIHDIGDDILQETLLCELCSKSYRIIPQELAFYQRQFLPIPRLCFSHRYLARLSKRTPHKLWDRHCDNCKKAIVTAMSPEVKRPVYCETCYQQLVY
ncbi:MAG: hypothetical protein A2V81_00525 [Candidatus Abawacabacteria bacterium RBG_16_42_10]|uniref:Caib/baif family protein n=1 Tax=Candidatus Abawacabacteria bacterium RBG_16_42_10 TaxID=1817814 RepID=A0A1F4XKH1_9BACT|nr:MAG: hypothetical protein A2V81_00525 [Candidatus Abawacabacteria bacterium RBG_16_42_10]